MSSSHNKEFKVIVGATYWTLNGVNIFSANLVRGLLEKGIDSHILLTEENTPLIQVNDARMERPTDIPFVELPVERWESWGSHWGMMIAYLENHAPCIYIPNSDWRHSSVCPLLSGNVGVIGVVHSDDPLHYDHVLRLGKYWNAIVTTSIQIAEKTVALDPSLSARICTIPIGVDIPFCFPRRAVAMEVPLKIIYHGTLKQHQKRIFDLPRIISRAAECGIPVKLSIAGGGPEEQQLRNASKELVDKGLVEFLGVIPHNKILTLLEEHDVYILTSEFEGMPNALLEAMGRGCIPVVTDIQSAIPDLVRHGDNGYIVPIGDIQGFVEKLELLHRISDQRHHMAMRAYEKVSSGRYRIQDMVQSYTDLIFRVFDESCRCVYKRPKGMLNHPPAEIGGVSLFPLEFHYEEEGVGRFPSLFTDYREFERQIQQIKNPEGSPLAHLIESNSRRCAADPRRLDGVKVIVASPVWTDTGVNGFSVHLVRQLRALGMSAHILLTEEETDLIDIAGERMPFPADVPFEHLPVERTASWGGQWGAMIRYLEEHAPCVYIPNDDWRHSCVTPLLSDRVAIIGIVHGDEPLHYNHVQRLGRYWDAIVAIDDTVAEKVYRLDASFAHRIAVVSNDADDVAQSYLRLINEVFDESCCCVYKRPKGILNHPPPEIDGVSLFPIEFHYEEEGVGRFPLFFRDYREFERQIQRMKNPEGSPLEQLIESGRRRYAADPRRLDGVKVIVASPVWTDTGVNEFSVHLVRQLRALGMSAHILLTEEETDLVDIAGERMPFPADVPFEHLPVERTASWGGQWGAMIRYLEEHAPCVYIPNDDWRHSCVTPLLSDRVAIIGIVHGDEPLHYNHVQRLGRYWDAIVAIDDTVAEKVYRLDASFAHRIAVVSNDADDVAQSYLRLINEVFDESCCCVYKRPKGILNHPPAEIGGVSLFPVEFDYEEEGVGRFPSLFTDYREFERQIQQIKNPEGSPLAHLMSL
jgi:glycosyltransferase involved in cell wall biosynthesis